MLVESSNDAARAISRVAEEKALRERKTFTDVMNELVLSVGLRLTRFHNASGLDFASETESGATGSIRDAALFFEYLAKKRPQWLEPTLASRSTATSLEGNEYRLINTNTLIDRIPHILASKTGYTGLAGGNLFIAFDDGIAHPIVIGVLGSSREGRFSDVMSLYQAFQETK
jgi:D-alanyl-D-alanine carboxypeptidase